jgi:DNA-binding transcriptional LysR family regulator
MSAVAEAFGQTSSAVSQQLAVLEREVNASLFERIGRRVQLTDEGKRMAAHAEAILQIAETARLDMATDKGSPRGEVAIACFSSFAKARLVPAIVRAKARYPDIHVVVHELEPADAVAAVRSGRCHLAITFSYNLVPRPGTRDLVVEPLLDEPVLLAVPGTPTSRPRAVRLEQFEEAEWIVGSRHAYDRILLDRACAVAGFAPRVTHEVDDYELILRLVAAGLGVSFVPQLAVQTPGADSVECKIPTGMTLRRQVQAITRPALVDSPPVRALLAELAANSETAPAQH